MCFILFCSHMVYVWSTKCMLESYGLCDA
jgi:hypothetical protein